MKRLFILLLLIGTVACSQEKAKTEQPQNLSAKVNALLESDAYSEALELLEDQEETEEVLRLQEQAYLNYGLFLEYRSEEAMRDRMNGALRQFVEVLKINPENEKAYSEVEQILGVYATFPNRSPEEDVAAELRELGFEI